MEFKGTKGKWNAKLGDVYSENQQDDEIICELQNYKSEKAKANALLISKAPEMLEMLKVILDSVDWSDNVWVNSEGRYIENKIEQLIKEATEIQ
jgi:hypothetical protein